nr:NADH dehydrogenase subunit 2 [Megacampsomeris sp. 1 YJY-2023a]
MKTNFFKYLCSPFYMFIMIMFFITESYFMKWLLMEMGSIILLSMMILHATSKKKSLYSFVYLMMIQVMTASLLLYFLMLKNYSSNEMFNSVMIYLIIFIKLGLFPFHYWYQYSINNLPWELCFILSTIYKILPLMFIYKINIMEEEFMLMFCLISMFMSSIKALMSKNMKNIFTYSSIININYMMIMLHYDFSMMLIYFLMYIMATLYFCYFSNLYSLNYQFDYFMIDLFMYKMSIFINNMMLAG